MTARPSRRRPPLVLAAVAAALTLTAGGASAQVPTEVPTLPSELPSLPGEEPSPSPSPTPSPSPSPSGPSSGAPAPPAPSPAPTTGPTPAPAPTTGAVAPVAVPSDRPDDAAPPEVAPPGAAAAGGATPPAAPPRTVLASPELAAAVPGAYTLTVLAALLGVGVLSLTFSLTDRGLLLARDPTTGGTNVERTRRWRVMAGTGLLGAAALVAIVGYLRISIETLVPVQLVYLASAGFGVVVLAAAGGALLVSEQLRADEGRIRDLEDALATLADRLAPAVAEPPRLLDRQRDAS